MFWNSSGNRLHCEQLLFKEATLIVKCLLQFITLYVVSVIQARCLSPSSCAEFLFNSRWKTDPLFFLLICTVTHTCIYPFVFLGDLHSWMNQHAPSTCWFLRLTVMSSYLQKWLYFVQSVVFIVHWIWYFATMWVETEDKELLSRGSLEC
jgi:hypothetical protein